MNDDELYLADIVHTFIIPPEGIDRIDTWLVTCCNNLPHEENEKNVTFSRSRIQGLLKAGRIKLGDKVIAKATEHTSPGDVVTVSIPPPVPPDPQPENIPLSIVFEDDDILVINKPVGLVVHPAPGHFTGTLVNALLYHCPNLSGIGGVARPGIVHRLDQDTSGILIVAKSEKAMQVLTKEFSDHKSIKKTYKTIVHRCPERIEGRLECLIGRNPYDRKKMAIVKTNGKNAITNYKVIETFHPMKDKRVMVSLVECRIETGRTHQIRVHMASLGCPVVGDRSYGRAPLDNTLDPHPPRQLLHAWKLELLHPVTREPLTFEAPLPEDFTPYLKNFQY